MDAFFVIAFIISLSTGQVHARPHMATPYKTYEACVGVLGPLLAQGERLAESGELVIAYGCMMRKEHKA